MKNTLLVSFLFFFSFQMQAQIEFAPVGATWHYGYFSYAYFSGFTEIVSVSDTSILGKVSKKLEVKTEKRNLVNGNIITDNEVHYLCNQGDTVFHYDPQSMIDFTVLFDFSMDSGDTLFYVDDWYYFVLDSIGTVELNGDPIIVQYGRTSTDQADHFVSTAVTAKFGPLDRFLFIDLLDWCFLGVQHGPCYDFRCYEDDNFPLLQLSEEDCDYIPGYESVLTDDKKWKYAFAACDIGGGYEARLGSDTLINTSTYKALIISDTCGNMANPGFLHENIVSGKLWFLRASDWEEILLMDMSLEVGDTFIYTPDTPEPLVTTTVSNIEFINGRKVITLSHYPSFCLTGGNLKFIEGVGTSAGMVKQTFFDDWNELPFLFGAGLICAQNDTITIYETPELSWMDCSISCLSTDVTEIQGSAMLMTISPNPVNRRLQINFSQPARKSSLCLFSATGELLREHPLPDGVKQGELNMDALSDGLYLLQFRENGRPVYSKKIIKN